MGAWWAVLGMFGAVRGGSVGFGDEEISVRTSLFLAREREEGREVADMFDVVLNVCIVSRGWLVGRVRIWVAATLCCAMQSLQMKRYVLV